MKIAIGGMIAAGKSTVVSKLGRQLNMPVMTEFEKDDEVFDQLLNWLYQGKQDVEMLLQLYFLHQHWTRQKAIPNACIIDRDIIEHWIFAQTNLVGKPEVMNMYNGLFYQYYGQIKKPDIYFILDVTFEVMLDRIKQRSRKQEVENLEKNIPYLRNLHKDYTKKLASQCHIHNIPCHTIDVNSVSADAAVEIIQQFLKTR